MTDANDNLKKMTVYHEFIAVNYFVNKLVYFTQFWLATNWLKKSNTL